LEEDPGSEEKIVIGLSVTRNLTLSPVQILELGKYLIEAKQEHAGKENRVSSAILIGGSNKRSRYFKSWPQHSKKRTSAKSCGYNWLAFSSPKKAERSEKAIRNQDRALG
jgi:K+-transporting ATPase c subunit